MRFLLTFLFAMAASAQPYDLIIRNGRVLDPATGLDAVRTIAIGSGKIAAVSTRPLDGRRVIDARGLTVTPGFIDLHSHGQTPENYAFKAMDGVTTALEMEVGAVRVPDWYAARTGKALINFGASAGHLPARMLVMHDTGSLLPRDAAVSRGATPRRAKADPRSGASVARRRRARHRTRHRLHSARRPRRDPPILQTRRRTPHRALRPHAQRRSCRTGRSGRAPGSARRRGRDRRFSPHRPHHEHGPARNAALPRNDSRRAPAGSTSRPKPIPTPPV